MLSWSTLNLQFLDLRINPLTSLDSATFSSLRNLKSLFAVISHRSNHYSHVCINLNKNKFASLPSGLFSNNIYLAYLSPTCNPVQFSSLSSLFISILSTTTVSHLSHPAYSPLSALSFLCIISHAHYSYCTSLLLHRSRFQLPHISRHGRDNTKISVCCTTNPNRMLSHQTATATLNPTTWWISTTHSPSCPIPMLL